MRKLLSIWIVLAAIVGVVTPTFAPLRGALKGATS